MKNLYLAVKLLGDYIIQLIDSDPNVIFVPKTIETFPKLQNCSNDVSSLLNNKTGFNLGEVVSCGPFLHFFDYIRIVLLHCIN